MPDFRLRPATASDFSFARTLYMASMKPLLTALDAWDDARAYATFSEYFKQDEVRIITVNGADIGWIQVSEANGEIHLDQLHLVEPFRDQGIGTRLIEQTMEKARQQNKPVRLSFVRGNRAVALYERLGFRIVGSDETKIHMQWGGITEY
jgi:ribosomal protein S18 acetylase RimI-like enzyme